MLQEVKGEAYVSLIYNYMKNEKNKINVFEVEKFICLGTPFDYKNYLFWNKYFKLYSNYKAKLQTNGINLIPMSGKGKRFKTYGL